MRETVLFGLAHYHQNSILGPCFGNWYWQSSKLELRWAQTILNASGECYHCNLLYIHCKHNGGWYCTCILSCRNASTWNVGIFWQFLATCNIWGIFTLGSRYLYQLFQAPAINENNFPPHFSRTHHLIHVSITKFILDVASIKHTQTEAQNICNNHFTSLVHLT